MDRLIAPNSVIAAQADAAPATGTPQFATDGNPATNVPATQWPAYQYNAFQEELMAILAAAGITPDRTNNAQILLAIKTLFQGSVSNVGIDTGTANTYVVAFTPLLTAPVPWAPFWFEVKTTNTGASTLNATGTVEPLVGGAHLALQGGELVAKGNALVYWNPTLASGAGSYVLMFCSGAPEQTSPATASQHAVQFGQVAGVVGQARNLKASLTVAGTSIIYTADEIVVESALGGLRYCLANFSQTLSGTSTGLGGLDTGSIAANSFYAIYAAETGGGAQGIFAQLEPAGGASSTYQGTHLPVGVIATALIGIWPTNSSSQFALGMQDDRKFWISPQTALSTSTQQSSLTSLSIASLVPKAAKRLSGNCVMGSSSATASVSAQVAGSSQGFGSQQLTACPGLANQANTVPFNDVPLPVTQTIYYSAVANAGTAALTISLTAFTF